MCSYKLVSVSFDVWALASRVESYVHKVSFSATPYNNKIKAVIKNVNLASVIVYMNLII